jgi:glycosyltransferase involved in cell wall biosynthesis
LPAIPRASILLPARDAGATLGEALDSLRAQTLTDWECIVIDDGSSDATGELAEGYARRDARFRLVRHPTPGGIVAALNLAASLARAPWLARQDADDHSLPDRLARSLELLAGDARLGAVACGVELFPPEAVPVGMRAYSDWLNGLVSPVHIEREIWVESPLPHPAVVMRRKAFAGCGGYRPGDWPEDYDLWLRMHAGGWRFAKVPEVLYRWRHHPRRLTLVDPRYRAEAFLECKLQHLAPLLRERGIVIWGAGRDGKRLARALRRHALAPLAFVDIDPRKIAGGRLGLPVLAPEALAGGTIPPWLAVRAPAPDGRPIVLVAVGTRGARGLIRARLRELGWSEPRGFLCLH